MVYDAATMDLLFHATATSLNDKSAGGVTRTLSRHRFRTPVRLILPSPVLADQMHHDEYAVDLHQRRKQDSATKYNANECKGESAAYTMPTMRTRPYMQRDERYYGIQTQPFQLTPIIVSTSKNIIRTGRHIRFAHERCELVDHRRGAVYKH